MAQEQAAAQESAAKNQTVGVVGLGLIGGSIAKAYQKAGYRVLGYDKDTHILAYAKLAGVIDDVLTTSDDVSADAGASAGAEASSVADLGTAAGARTDTGVNARAGAGAQANLGAEADAHACPPAEKPAGNLGTCDLVFLALYPAATIEYVQRHRADFSKTALVIDCCGVKEAICEACFPIAAEEGFTFVGGHPMAGTEYSGFKVSRADLFQGASMVIVPPVFDDIRLLTRVKEALAPLGFARFRVTRAAHHDRMIAYTSQLSHIASNAFVKSPVALEEEGYSGGSFRDLTRVAYLNEVLWSELFMYNKGPLLEELDILIESLTDYRDAIEAGDTERLQQLLREGRERKEMLEGTKR